MQQKHCLLVAGSPGDAAGDELDAVSTDYAESGLTIHAQSGMFIGVMVGAREDKALVILSGEIKTPPLSDGARRELGFLIRTLQKGLRLEMPHSRPMPTIGRRCHELRVNDAVQTWRVLYRTDSDAILVLAVFSKKTAQTPKRSIDQAMRLLREYDAK